MSKLVQYAVLAAILSLAVFFRFFNFRTLPPGLGPDEAMNGNNAVQAAETAHYQIFYTDNNGREGLYVNLVAFLLKQWPIDEPWVIRAPAGVAGVLTVWGLYLATAELFGARPALLAAFMLATSTWHVSFSRVGLRAILGPLLLVWSIWLLLKAFGRSPNAPHCPTSMASSGYAAAAATVYGLGFYTYIAYRITPLFLLLILGHFRSRSAGFWRNTAIFSVVTLAVSAPLAWYFYSHPGTFLGRTSQISVTNEPNPAGALVANLIKEALMFNVHGDRRQNFSGAPELSPPVGLLFLLGVAICVISLVRPRLKQRSLWNSASIICSLPSFPVVLTLTWLALGLLPAAMSQEAAPHALRSILALPPAMVLSAIGGIGIHRLLREVWQRPNVARAVAGAFVAVTTVLAYREYFGVVLQRPELARELNVNDVKIGRRINLLPASTPKYVIVNPDCDVVRGIPVAAATVMFITHSFSAAEAEARNIHYIVAPRPGKGTTTDQVRPSGEVFYLGNNLDNLDCD